MTFANDGLESIRFSRRVTAAAPLAIVVALALTACGSSGATPASPPGSGAGRATAGGRTTPPLVEVNPPGDIPDNQAYVGYAGAGYRVSVPEGWARTVRRSGVLFTDKYNSITITTSHAGSAPTPVSARSKELPAIRASAKGYTPGTITTVRRSAGTAVLITYHALSPVNPVTGKVAQQAVERYEYWRSGREVVLTLAAPVGSDNVDPWRKITDSFTWTRK